MGFFSSRRALAEDGYLTDGAVERSKMVKVIRSRFYGKHTKEKEKDSDSNSNNGHHPIANTFIPQGATTAQTLSIPNTHSNIRKSRSTTNILKSPSSVFSSSSSTGAGASSPTRGLSISDRFRSTRAKATSSTSQSPTTHTQTLASPSDVHVHIHLSDTLSPDPTSSSTPAYITTSAPASASTSASPSAHISHLHDTSSSSSTSKSPFKINSSVKSKSTKTLSLSIPPSLSHTLSPSSASVSAQSATDPSPNPNANTSTSASTMSPSSRRASAPRATNTDNATMSLAQKLNELAVANSAGLLNDEEYRLLRQNLFERYASNAAVPTESPVVPATPSRHGIGTGQGTHLRAASGASTDKRSSISRPPSQFIVDVNVSSRSPSLRSKSSIRSGVAGLFQRATSHHKQESSRDYAHSNYSDVDASSVYSRETFATGVTGGGGTGSGSRTGTGPGVGRTGSIFRSPLRKKSSNASVRSGRSGRSIGSQQTDAISISSKTSGYAYPQTPRSAAASSFRNLVSPPSSFHGHGHRSLANENKYSSSFDEDETIKSSKEIRSEIAAVEAEGRRLMDAFNGLEVTVLAKRQRFPNGKGVGSRVVEVSGLSNVRDEGEGGGVGDHDGQGQGSSTWTLKPDHRLVLKIDTDGASVRSGRSGTSVGTSPSLGRSIFLKTLPAKASSSMMSTTSTSATSSRAESLHRKNSSSSVASSRHNRSISTTSRVPPVPALPLNMMGQYLGGHASSSSLNLTRSTGHPPMRAVPEDEVKSMSSANEQDEDAELDAEMEEIRKRREAVARRYAARVEYLKAKLKGAQLHEKLMKR